MTWSSAKAAELCISLFISPWKSMFGAKIMTKTLGNRQKLKMRFHTNTDTYYNLFQYLTYSALFHDLDKF